MSYEHVRMTYAQQRRLRRATACLTALILLSVVAGGLLLPHWYAAAPFAVAAFAAVLLSVLLIHLAENRNILAHYRRVNEIRRNSMGE